MCDKADRNDTGSGRSHESFLTLAFYRRLATVRPNGQSERALLSDSLHSEIMRLMPRLFAWAPPQQLVSNSFFETERILAAFVDYFRRVLVNS